MRASAPRSPATTAPPDDGTAQPGDALIERLRERLAAPDMAEPLYARLGRELEGEIEAGRLATGETLPGERVLAEGLSLSRVTVRKAIDGLVEANRLVRRPGAGTAVAGRLEKSLTRLTGFSEDMAARGLVPGCIWLLKERANADLEEARALGLPFGAAILRLRRIRTASGTPIAWERTTVPGWVLDDPQAVEQSLYQVLEDVGAAPVRAVQRLRAEAATPADAQHLRCAPGAPILVMERRCFEREGRIVESTQSRYLGEAYDFITDIVR